MTFRFLLVVAGAVAGTAAAQAPIAPTVLIDSADSLGTPSLSVATIYAVVAGPTRGYAVGLGLRAAASGPVDRGVIWGDLVDDGTTSPTVLRETQTIQGVQQHSFGGLAIGSSSLAYEAVVPDINGIPRSSLWIDDDLQFIGHQSPSPLPGWDLTGVGRISMAENGSVIAGVGLRDSASMQQSSAIVEFPSGIVQLGPGSALPGTSMSVDFAGFPSISPDGAHWTALVVLTDGRRAAVLDGAVYSIDGSLVIEGEIIPPRAGGNGLRRWGLALPQAVDVLGRVTLAETEPGSLLTMPPSSVLLDGSRLLGYPETLAGATIQNNRVTVIGRGGRVASAWRDSFLPPSTTDFVYGNRWLSRAGTFGVDVDANGSVESNWRLTALTSLSPQIAVTARGDVLLVHGIEDPGVETRLALLRFRPEVGSTSCAAQLNSSGVPARIVSLGLDEVAVNDLQLRVSDLPRNTVGYVLASTTPGFSPGAGGSSGDLCLGGSIGRYAGNVLSSGDVGAFTMPLDLTSIAQPTGSVAAIPGATWIFQAWFRDSVGGSATSNFTEAVAVTMR